MIRREDREFQPLVLQRRAWDRGHLLVIRSRWLVEVPGLSAPSASECSINNVMRILFDTNSLIHREALGIHSNSSLLAVTAWFDTMNGPKSTMMRRF